MTGYTKLFGRILDSTIWQEDNPTRILWITMLAMADRDGLVMASVPGLASRAKITLSECEAGLAKFQEPDPYSQSPIDEGRRIQVIQGGWLLINYESYRHKMNAEEQREKARLRQQRSRMSRQSVTERDSHAMSLDVAPSHYIAEAKEEAKEEGKSKSSRFAPPTLEEVTAFCRERNNDVDPVKFHAHYECQGWYAGPRKMKSWRSAVIKWERNNFGGPFRDGYQKTGRTERQQLGTQAQREFNNAEAIFGATVGRSSALDSPGQETRPDRRSYALLEGKIKAIP